MKTVFMGSPDFAVPSLEKLYKMGFDIAGVVTQPDRPKGRGKKLLPTPVKIFAQSAGLKIFQPEKIKTPEFIRLLRNLSPQVIVVVAFGQLLSPELLQIPQFGCINVHASLLPKYRGAAPIHRAVINGEKVTGVTTMYMDEGLDTGDMILSQELPVEKQDTVGMVHDRLAVLGAEVLERTLQLVDDGEAPRQKQQDSSATYAPLLTKADEIINWHSSAREICNHIRGMNPWPGTCTYLDGQVIKIWQATYGKRLVDAIGLPGQVMASDAGGIIIQAGQDQVCIKELQLQCCKRMMTADFLRGKQIPEGRCLGD
ncbi:methionyl-tRNA formyltransferase [Desulfofarcimen acetoxidans DSM 771]|jgi:methionyl-tRNA formyltransferase|uniref:Methionyl-tRNA formyltransferase n=1 Tax=Desulfofarcimen acetoxidans (strain ATCC 49208 / DSM 771 / KCTC 5769 / VKM B-1644 / 5575) TaxID=485916 RepID=C8W071_DESAS|nr:methionyl-tRNA formyltransferase [Desulfofarcimen acetoxidans]ACV63126.1 methionyl-tRNA formyltransferase [Desulfofarcimen acetoxidans DSM 771]